MSVKWNRKVDSLELIANDPYNKGHVCLRFSPRPSGRIRVEKLCSCPNDLYLTPDEVAALRELLDGVAS